MVSSPFARTAARWLHPGLLLLALLWCAAFVVAPLLTHSGGLYAWFGGVCHQAAERSLQVAGAPLALCARCSGIYVAGALGLALLTLPGLRRRVLPFALPMLLLGGAVMASQVVAEQASVMLGGNVVRLGTGLLFGGGAAAVAVAALHGDGMHLPTATVGRLALALLIATPTLACQPKKKRQPHMHVPKTAEAQACKGECSEARGVCDTTTPECLRKCPPDRTTTPYENEKAICAKHCNKQCHDEWIQCVSGCPGAHWENEPRSAGTPHKHPTPPPQTPVIIQQPSGCRGDIDCKGSRLCIEGACVDAPQGPVMIVPVDGCSKDADCKADRVCAAGVCQAPAGTPAPQPQTVVTPQAPAPVNRAACDACAGTCATFRASCDRGSVKDCYRAGACMCRCRLDAGGCGSEPAELRSCISDNEARAR